MLQNCIAGAGDTLPNMVISLAAIWAVQLPLAFLLPRFTGLGIYGVRWAMVAATIAGSLAYAVYFRRGRWKLKPVDAGLGACPGNPPEFSSVVVGGR